MSKVLGLNGNAAAAHAMRQINPHVVAAYPITPQTDCVERFAEFVSEGLVDTEFVTVESEHSALSACIGAAAAGGRVMTATSSQGLALMWEMLYIAASMRLPIVMMVVNRALSGNINIHCDHSDTMGARDAGWIQLFSENAQEVYDNMVQAVRIAEDMRVRLPVMVTQDGFIISHAVERVELLDDEEVRNFVGPYRPLYPLLDVRNPVTYGPLDLFDYYFEHKRSEIEAIDSCLPVIEEVGKEFGKLSGRSYGLLEEYRLEDAEYAVVALGSTCGTAKEAVDRLRDRGKKVGLLKIRCFRPFPKDEVIRALAPRKGVAVLDRSVVLGGFGGPVFTEIRSALYDLPSRPLVIDFYYGLGGRDIYVEDIERAFARIEEVVRVGRVEKHIDYLGLRE
ncbi:transketolase C-terminal domain-containing protein [Candidatus Caldatribacterium sp. SIUC1]|uniref:transketolase C-terminal domain-containing protein n=1 Tax=Candidatus Caldatribacterium sp. SIUC1 TaxID=3418365 RepID=UPI003F691AC3